MPFQLSCLARSSDLQKRSGTGSDVFMFLFFKPLGRAMTDTSPFCGEQSCLYLPKSKATSTSQQAGILRPSISTPRLWRQQATIQKAWRRSTRTDVQLTSTCLSVIEVSDSIFLRLNTRPKLILMSTFYDGAGLLDADKAVELRSDWDRAYARRAECYTQLGDFDLARQQCAFLSNQISADLSTNLIFPDELAVQHAQDLAAKSRFSSAIAALRSREQSIQTARLMAVSIDFPARISALEAEGKTEFVEGGAAELVLTAYGWVDDAMQKIDRDVVGDDKTFQSKVPSGILTLTGPLCFHLIFSTMV